MRGISFALFLLANGGSAYAATPDSFNIYIQKAVAELNSKFAGKGYDIKKAYTHAYDYADGQIKPTDAPWTMCVAAVAEVITTAINIYVKETDDKSPYSALPVAGWNRMRPTDIRSHIWVDPRLDSYGTGDALVTFGVGKRVPFSELTPGSFINLNRNRPGRKPSGHAVVFQSFIDKDGKELSAYSDKVVGFRYFSSQGSGNSPGAGFGYRYAFFNKSNNEEYCPTLDGGRRVDCGVMYSKGQKLLNTGYMLHPSKWDADARSRNLKSVVDGVYVQVRSRGDGNFIGIPGAESLSPDSFATKLLEQDTMMLNPIFDEANTGGD